LKIRSQPPAYPPIPPLALLLPYILFPPTSPTFAPPTSALSLFLIVISFCILLLLQLNQPHRIHSSAPALFQHRERRRRRGWLGSREISREAVGGGDVAEGGGDAEGVGEEGTEVEAVVSDVVLELLTGSAVEGAGEEEMVPRLGLAAIAQTCWVDADGVERCIEVRATGPELGEERGVRPR